MRGSPSEQGLVAFHAMLPLPGCTANTRPSSSSTARSPATATTLGRLLPMGSSVVHSSWPAASPVAAVATSAQLSPSSPAKAMMRSSPYVAGGVLW